MNASNPCTNDETQPDQFSVRTRMSISFESVLKFKIFELVTVIRVRITPTLQSRTRVSGSVH